MAIDIRADVECSLGPLVSASISDDYIQGNGLIKCKGNCVIKGTITPAMGTIVTFSYTQQGVTRQVPRRLRVLSSFTDPFRRITTVELGCKLTYLSDLAPAPQINGDSRTETGKRQQCLNGYIDYPAESEFGTPIYASMLAQRCISALGIAGYVPLKNKFFIEEFDFSPGYVQVLGDLLVSESYCGYLDTSEYLVVFSLAEAGGSGPVVDASKIIDVSGIGTGSLPGDAVVVRYNSLKLKEDQSEENETDKQKRNWELVEEIGDPVSVNVEYEINGQKNTRTYTYIPYTKTKTTYGEDNSWDNDECVVFDPRENAGIDLSNTAIKVEKWNRVMLAEQANDYCAKVLAVGGSPYGYVTGDEYSITEHEYDEGNLIKTTTKKYEPYFAWAGRLNVDWVIRFQSNYQWPILAEAYDVLIEEETIEIENVYESDKWYLIADGMGGANWQRAIIGQRTVQNTYKHWALTQQGQQAYAGTRENYTFNTADDLVVWLNYHRQVPPGLVDTQVTVRTSNILGFEQKRPPKELRLGNNSERVEREAQLVYAEGSPGSKRIIEMSMPYQDDDHYTSGGHIIKGEAEAQSLLYGRCQNRLLYGNRYGMNVQLQASIMPEAPFSPLYLQANGLTGLYRTNGTSYQMSADGILASTDALFWGGVGGQGIFWFPVAPGITTLPETPPVVNGQTNATSLVPVWNEITVLQSRIKTGITVTKFNYALDLPIISVPLSIKVRLVAANVRKIAIPSAVNATLAALAPAVRSGGSAKPAAVAIAIVAPVPAVSSGGSVAIPAVAITTAGLDPEQAGKFKRQVFVPAAAVTIAANAPTVASGGSVTVPVKDVAVAGLAPAAGYIDPNFSAVSLLLHMDGTNGSTTFTDSSSNALTVTANGNAQISTTQSKFGGASAYFDGTGDYLSATSAGFLFDTGDFSIELWFNVSVAFSATNQTFAGVWGPSNYAWILQATSTSVICAFGNATAYVNQILGSWTAPSTGTWNHLAVTRSGTTAYIFLNGVQLATTTIATNISGTGVLSIGRNSDFNQQYITGYIDELRITKGVARYTANFTPPTAAINADTSSDPYLSNVSLLLKMNGANNSTTFTDSSLTPKAVFANGDAKISTAQSKFGGSSALFDGTGDWLSTTLGASIGTDSFTIECWAYINSLAATAPLVCIGDDFQSSGLLFYVNTSGRIAAFGNNAVIATGSTQTITTGSWFHLAITRNVSSVALFVNGVLDGTATNSASLTNAGRIGAELYNSATGAQLNGYIDDLRITKGVARYTANFTPSPQAFPNK